jgi:hypothetical protein
MNRTLIAIATAGLLASGAAVASTTGVHAMGDQRSNAFVAVQYYGDRAQYYAERSEDRAANVNERETRINARIQRGLENGSITNREARRLYHELNNIEAKERAFRSDGRLDWRESQELNRDLDRLAENVREQRLDSERRY